MTWPGITAITHLVLGGAALSVLCGCNNFEVDWSGGASWSSAHFEYHFRDDDTAVCEEVMPELERHLAVITAELDISWPDSEQLVYYKFRDTSDVREHGGCPAFASGCQYGDEIRTARAFDPHELVHAYVSPRWGGSVALLQEGIAVALSCYPWRPVDRSRDWRDVFEGTQTGQGADYALAGALVTLLLELPDGAANLERLYRSLERSDSKDDFARRFQDVYGVSLDMMWQTMLSGIDIPVCIPAWACSAEELAADGDIGPHCAGSGERVLSSAAAGSGVVLDTEGSRLRAIACDGSNRHALLEGTEPELGILHSEHWVQGFGIDLALTRFGEGNDIPHGTAPTHVTMDPVTAPWVGAECASLSAVTLKPDTVTTVLTPEQNQYIRFEAEPGQRFGLLFDGVARSCETCDDQACEDVFGFTEVVPSSRPIFHAVQPLGLGVLRVEPIP